MSPYQIHLILDALVSEFSMNELEDTERLIPLVSTNCNLSRKDSVAILEGAQDIKAARHGNSDTTFRCKRAYIH